MDTQAINTKANKEASKEALKKAKTIVGSAALGAGAVIAGDIIQGDEKLDVVEPIENITDIESPTTEDVAENTDSEATGHAAEAHETSTNEPQPQGPTVEDQHNMPTAGEHHGQNGINIDDIPDVDPNLVVHDLTDDVIMVDPTDIDAGNLDIAAIGKIETVDGQTLTAAQFTGENGETLYMVDVDGDNSYELVTDAAGNVLANVPSPVTVSDTENIIGVNTGDTGFLAQNEHDTPAEHDTDVSNVMDDVIDLS